MYTEIKVKWIHTARNKESGSVLSPTNQVAMVKTAALNEMLAVPAKEN